MQYLIRVSDELQPHRPGRRINSCLTLAILHQGGGPAYVLPGQPRAVVAGEVKVLASACDSEFALTEGTRNVVSTPSDWNRTVAGGAGDQLDSRAGYGPAVGNG